MASLHWIWCLPVPIVLMACSAIGASSSSLQIDPSDPCGSERKAFSQSQGYFTNEIVSKTAEGAFSSGFKSLLAGGTSGAGLWQSIAQGGEQGFKAGYWEALQQQQMDKQQLAQTVNRDLQQESQQISHTAATFGTLRSCRLAQGSRIKSDVHRGSINRAEAKRLLDQEHSWFEQEIAAAETAGLNMEKRDGQLQYAAENLGRTSHPVTPTSHAATSTRPQRGTSPVTTAATETLPEQRNSFEATVNDAKIESASAFKLDSSESSSPTEERHA